MSWMDSWSRPSKHQATPAPYYLLPGGESTPYCKSCGRVIGARKADANKNGTPAKYCSSRCRSRKPGVLDRRIEDAFVAVLQDEELPLPEGKPSEESQHIEVVIPANESRSTKRGSKKGKKKPKGDARILASCVEVEKLVFGDRFDPDKTSGRKRDRAKRGVTDDGDWQSVDMVDGDPDFANDSEVVDGDLLARMSIRSGTRIRPAQDVSEVNGGVGGEKGWAERIEENEEMLEKRLEGQRRAHERELVRCAARRGVAFGFLLKSADSAEERRKCEAVMQGKVVESSFAKGDWSIRWREG